MRNKVGGDRGRTAADPRRGDQSKGGNVLLSAQQGLSGDRYDPFVRAAGRVGRQLLIEAFGYVGTNNREATVA